MEGLGHALWRWMFWHRVPPQDHLPFVWQQSVVWMIWTAIFCVLGWLIVGIASVVWSEQLVNKRLSVTSAVAGSGGAVILLTATFLATVKVGRPLDAFAPAMWILYGLAFGIGALAMLFYRLFLQVGRRNRSLT